MTPTKKTDPMLFIELVQQGIETWIEAGELAAKCIDQDPDFPDKVADLNKFISPEYVKKFADIGRRKIFPQLLLAESQPGPRRLKRLPYALQEKFCKEPLPVLIAGGETLAIDILNLTANQAAQVIDVSEQCIRSEAQQRAWIEDQKAQQMSPSIRTNLPYRIVRGELIITEGCRLNRKELAKILADMSD